jgi:hypothetical protein
MSMWQLSDSSEMVGLFFVSLCSRMLPEASLSIQPLDPLVYHTLSCLEMPFCLWASHPTPSLLVGLFLFPSPVSPFLDMMAAECVCTFCASGSV